MLPLPLLIFAQLPDWSAAAPKLYVGVQSGVTNRQKRDGIRAACFKATYEPAGIHGVFYVNQPDLGRIDNRRKRQGIHAPAVDQAHSHALARESEEHGDMVFGLARDTYMDKSTKVVQLFRDGVAAGADFIVKTDDDTCLRPKYLLGLLSRLQAKRMALSATGWREFYVGWHEFKGHEFKIMAGPNNTIAPFMSGPIYILSAGLARTVVDTDRVHTALFQRYGTSSEDANMGKWVKYATEKHGLIVEHVADRRIFTGSGNIYGNRTARQGARLRGKRIVASYNSTQPAQAGRRHVAYCHRNHEEEGAPVKVGGEASCINDMYAEDPTQNICGPCGCSGCPLRTARDLPLEFYQVQS